MEYRSHLSESGQEAAAPLSSSSGPLPKDLEADGKALEGAETPPESLERIEAALKLVVDHLNVSARAAQVLEPEQARIVLAAVALGISATSVLALLSLAAILPAVAPSLLGVAMAMALIFLGSVLDLSSATSLRKAVNKAVQERQSSGLALERGSWWRLFQAGYRAELRRISSDLLFYRWVRLATVVIYIIGVVYMIWSVLTLYL